jgi:hypothetical protein
MAAFAEFVASLFWNGPKRWLVLTFPALLVGIATLWSNYITPLPPKPFLAVLWQPHVWTWVIAVLLGLLVASYISWFEQHSLLREISGMPEVVMELTADNAFSIRTDHPVYDVRIEDVVFQKPEKDMELARKVFASMHAEYPGAEPIYYTDWKLKFDALQVIHPSNAGRIGCWVGGMALAPFQVLKYILGAVATSNELEVPIILCYSNTGTPKRNWHAHFVITYQVSPEKLGLRHVNTGEVHPRKNACSRCEAISYEIVKRNDLLN